MFAWSRHIYIQIAPQQVQLRVPQTGAWLSESADIALTHTAQGHRVIAAVGTAARQLQTSANVQLLQPFAHPRSIISDVEVAEALLRHTIRQVLQMRWIMWAPTVVIHPLGLPEGGWTAVEMRALHAMAIGAGARKAYVWTGQPLPDQAILAAPRPFMGGQWWWPAVKVGLPESPVQ